MKEFTIQRDAQQNTAAARALNCFMVFALPDDA